MDNYNLRNYAAEISAASRDVLANVSENDAYEYIRSVQRKCVATSKLSQSYITLFDTSFPEIEFEFRHEYDDTCAVIRTLEQVAIFRVMSWLRWSNVICYNIRASDVFQYAFRDVCFCRNTESIYTALATKQDNDRLRSWSLSSTYLSIQPITAYNSKNLKLDQNVICDINNVTDDANVAREISRRRSRRKDDIFFGGFCQGLTIRSCAELMAKYGCKRGHGFIPFCSDVLLGEETGTVVNEFFTCKFNTSIVEFTTVTGNQTLTYQRDVYAEFLRDDHVEYKNRIYTHEIREDREGVVIFQMHGVACKKKSSISHAVWFESLRNKLIVPCFTEDGIKNIFCDKDLYESIYHTALQNVKFEDLMIDAMARSTHLIGGGMRVVKNERLQQKYILPIVMSIWSRTFIERKLFDSIHTMVKNREGNLLKKIFVEMLEIFNDPMMLHLKNNAWYHTFREYVTSFSLYKLPEEALKKLVIVSEVRPCEFVFFDNDTNVDSNAVDIAKDIKTTNLVGKLTSILGATFKYSKEQLQKAYLNTPMNFNWEVDTKVLHEASDELDIEEEEEELYYDCNTSFDRSLLLNNDEAKQQRETIGKSFVQSQTEDSPLGRYVIHTKCDRDRMIENLDDTEALSRSGEFFTVSAHYNEKITCAYDNTTDKFVSMTRKGNFFEPEEPVSTNTLYHTPNMNYGDPLRKFDYAFLYEDCKSPIIGYDGVAGVGKTHVIRECAQVPDIVLTETRNAAEELKKEIFGPTVLTFGEFFNVVIDLYRSGILQRCKRLIIDECTLALPGLIDYIRGMIHPIVTIIFYDSQQIGATNRHEDKIWMFDKECRVDPDRVFHLNVSRRCPKDAAKILSFFYPYGMRTTNNVSNSISVVRKKPDADLYMCHTNNEKRELKKQDVDAKTVTGSQGSSVETSCLYITHMSRLAERNDHKVVSFSRHKRKMYIWIPEDAPDVLYNKYSSLVAASKEDNDRQLADSGRSIKKRRDGPLANFVDRSMIVTGKVSGAIYSDVQKANDDIMNLSEEVSNLLPRIGNHLAI